VERPQHLWLRVSVGIHGDNIAKVKEIYDLMSQKYFIHAKPTIFNAGTPRPQLSSCYLIAMEEDSLEGIFDTLKDCAKISKWAGGIGLHIHNIRANNSLIRGTNGKSSGLVPMLKVFNDTARFINQGGKRNGSFAIYLEPWHPDIEDFLEMRKNHGDEEMRARDLFYALWTPDLFMERVKENAKWSYFCPDECPGLADVYGDAFKTLYEKYEAEGRERKRVNARDLWFKILDAQMETGTPYLLFKDAANEKSNQKNLGTIKSSNLCVAPETKILTDKGHVEIGRLEGQQVNIWNGEEFSEVTIHKTGENQELMEVETSDGCILSCTPYHKFYIQNNHDEQAKLVEAQHLKEGDKLIPCEFPLIDGNEIKNDTFDVPINGSLENKKEYFANIDNEIVTIIDKGEKQTLQITSIDKDFLYKVKFMLQTCSINPEIIQSYLYNPIYRLVIKSCDIQKLKENGFHHKKLMENIFYKCTNTRKKIQITATRRTGRIDDTFCFNEPKKHAGIFNGIITSQCTEILEYSDDKETAVCNLASVSLPAFVQEKEKVFDYDKLHEVVKVMTSNLNRVIDINYYPTPKTQRSNFLHRPIGIGVQGLADVFMMMDIPFHSEEAKEINKQIFETMYHAALERSNEIAKERSEKILDKIKTRYKSEEEFVQMWENFQTVYNDSGDEHKHEKMIMQPDHELYALDITFAEMTNIIKELGDKCGAYSSFEGSPASQGILQYDFWKTTPSPKYDWQKLKDSIQKYGLRNSLLLAPMPTASTSQILGNNECFEPLTSNIYSRSTLAGEFVVANKYLMRDLIKLGFWNEKIKNNIVANKGSIQQLTILPEEIRNKYKIVWEIPMKHLIDMSADRGAFICQSQSLNLWQEDPTYNTLTSMHFYSWKKGLKTGIYYLRRKGKHQAQQFTVEPDKKEKEGQEKDENDICEMCSA